MRQTIDSRAKYIAVSVGVLIVVAVGLWAWTRPSSTASPESAVQLAKPDAQQAPGNFSTNTQRMLEGHQTPGNAPSSR